MGWTDFQYRETLMGPGVDGRDRLLTVLAVHPHSIGNGVECRHILTRLFALSVVIAMAVNWMLPGTFGH
ncbi:hypothetical protein BDW74DRAFT_162342 [Aspergillus multicolor]|uniref:uncharacterized protein n=1 Tax=Aspergillus multicolor TaxID=41759 RepID=UPI003CCD0282